MVGSLRSPGSPPRASRSCAGAKPHVVEPGRSGIGRIDVKGAASLDHDDLLDGLGLVHARAEGRPFERYLVAMDRRRVRGNVARRGFFDAEIIVDVDRGPRTVDVTFAIAHGPRARARSRRDRGRSGGLVDQRAGACALIALSDGAVRPPRLGPRAARDRRRARERGVRARSGRRHRVRRPDA